MIIMPYWLALAHRLQLTGQADFWHPTRSSWPCRPRWRDGSCTTPRCPECATS